MEVYLEGGFRPVEGTEALPSTIVDATARPLRVVRQGAISLERLREVVPGVLGVGEEPSAVEPPETPETAETSETPKPPKRPPSTIPRGTDMQPKVAVAAVTFDRHEELALLLKGLAEQTAAIHSIALVDSGTVPATDVVRAGGNNINYLRSEANLGGAGGFAYAILAAMASGAEWIWMMDDDGHPEDASCLAELLSAAEEHQLDIVSPLVAATATPTGSPSTSGSTGC